jgi:tRNA(Ile)-lysidine synthase
MRIAVACSGGADSVALLRLLLERRGELGLVLSVAHMNHGIRGVEADADQAFVEALALQFELPLYNRRVDTPAAAEINREGLEEAARKLRYAWFQEVLADGNADAVVTAHTLDDQAETVLHRLIRGAWTDGLGGIFPILNFESKTREKASTSLILRPFLSTTRNEIEAWLLHIGQPWREDSTNRDIAYTRNSLRHELLPVLAEYNPKIKGQLAHLATLARDDEAWWQAELGRILPSLLLPGKAVRGGGRATNTLRGDDSLSIEVDRLRGLHPALRRRVLRSAAAQLGANIDFDDTERLLDACGLAGPDSAKAPGAGFKLQMERGLRAERTPRELRLFRVDFRYAPTVDRNPMQAEYALPIPGTVDAPSFGIRLQATVGLDPRAPLPAAILRASRPGDRVALRHSRSRLKIKEALQRARLPVESCPVLEWQGEIVWMPGLAIESGAAQSAVLTVTSAPLK